MWNTMVLLALGPLWLRGICCMGLLPKFLVYYSGYSSPCFLRIRVKLAKWWITHPGCIWHGMVLWQDMIALYRFMLIDILIWGLLMLSAICSVPKLQAYPSIILVMMILTPPGGFHVFRIFKVYIIWLLGTELFIEMSRDMYWSWCPDVAWIWQGHAMDAAREMNLTHKNEVLVF